MSGPAYGLGIAAIVRWGAPYLTEWVAYHQLVGAEHFWLYTDSGADGCEAILGTEVDAGIVEVIDWPLPESGDTVAYAVHAYMDALARARSRMQWLAVLDIDEFILPMADENVPTCLNRLFQDASAVYVNWRNFGTGGVYLGEGEPILFRLTACAHRDHPNNSVGKSIVRPDRVRIDKVWYEHHFVLEPGAAYYDGDGQALVTAGREPVLDGKHHDRCIRINHYPTRDENYFRNVRLWRTDGPAREAWLEWEHYHAFSASRDFAITQFISDRHPVAYAALWEQSARAERDRLVECHRSLPHREVTDAD